jgi:DNA-binding PucR family transcriptional regulator
MRRHKPSGTAPRATSSTPRRRRDTSSATRIGPKHDLNVGLMADARGQGDVEVDRWVAELAVRLGDRVSEAVSVISASLREDIPELRDQAQVELFNAAVEGNVVTALYALRHNIPVERVEAPTTALEHARRIAQQGVPLNVLIRMYRLGQRRFTRLVLSELQNIEIASQARMTVVDKITETLFAYVDWMSQQIIEVYEEEREGWLETRNSMRAVRVREVLTGRTPVDIDSAIKTIGYPLRWHHVALLLWYPAASGDASELGRMQRFVRELGIAAQAGAPPLFIAADRSTGWAWLPYQSTPTEVVAAVRNFTMQFDDSPSVAIGSSATGVEGFRRSHVQAEAVRWVVLARKDIKPTVVADSDPGLAAAALVGANVEQARDWVAEVLGGLATNTDNDARLRETLRVFLGCGSSNRLAAGELVVHYNTVKYRVGRSLARRGRSITNDRFDVELALLLCHWYGDAVLLPSTP